MIPIKVEINLFRHKYIGLFGCQAAKEATALSGLYRSYHARVANSRHWGRLSELRHPLVHYNKRRAIRGMRSSHFVKESIRKNNFDDYVLKFGDEIDLLKCNLQIIDTALRKSLLLIEEWCVIENVNSWVLLRYSIY